MIVLDTVAAMLYYVDNGRDCEVGGANYGGPVEKKIFLTAAKFCVIIMIEKNKGGIMTQPLEPKPYPEDNDYLIYPDGKIWSKKSNKFLIPQKAGRGYFRVGLSIDGKVKCYYVHRLVAEVFVPNPNNYPQVNHIDENKENNNYQNLEWVTVQQNANHATRNARISETNKKLFPHGAGRRGEHPEAKKVEMLDPKTQDVLETFDSITSACDYLQKPNAAGSISRACRGIYKTAYGYSWRFCD